MIPSFKFHLNNPIQQGTSSIGKYDGKHPSLTCATSAGKVLIHNPHERNSSKEQSLNYLNINREVTALTTGMYENDGFDTLFIGTQTNLLSYNVEKNADIFYKDIPDGVSSITFGKMPSSAPPLAVVGGNCSIQGFDYDGNELYWTVTGDNVTAMTFCDVTGDGQEELVVGSEDYEIRAFQQEEVVCEITETDSVVDLCPVDKKLYGYALRNGSVGIYKRKARAWRVKSKNQPTSITNFDIDGDGISELMIGWSNGKLEARRVENGSVVYKDSFSSSIASIVKADYRLSGNEEVICCSSEGEVRGYSASSTDDEGFLMPETQNSEEAEVFRLSKAKAALSMELKSLERNVKSGKTGKGANTLIPSTTQISTSIKPNTAKSCCVINISTNNDTTIKMVAIFDYDSGLFERESIVEYCSIPTTSIEIPIYSTKFVHAELHLKVIVGARGNSNNFHVFEETVILPKFAFFEQISQIKEKPTGYVRFKTTDRYQKVGLWVAKRFLVDGGNTTSEYYYFSPLNNDGYLCILANANMIEIRTDNMRIAAELVQDLGEFLELDELETIADFPTKMSEFRDLLITVDDFNSTRLKLTAEMADESNQVKNLVIRAEDARIIHDMKLMRQMYADLFTLNNQLLGEYTKRSTNHQALLSALKEVNNMIQLAARLRIGNAKTKVISACRKAIKENNIHSLFHIIKTGQEEVP